MLCSCSEIMNFGTEEITSHSVLVYDFSQVRWTICLITTLGQVNWTIHLMTDFVLNYYIVVAAKYFLKYNNYYC